MKRRPLLIAFTFTVLLAIVFAALSVLAHDNRSPIEADATEMDTSAEGTAEATESAAIGLEVGLIAYYPFDGDVEDHSDNDNTGEASNIRFSSDRHGNEDGALRLNGERAFIEVPNAESLNIQEEVTISFWLFYEPQATGTWYTVLEKTGPADGHARYGFWIIRDLVEFCIEPASNAPRVGPQSCLDSTTSLREDDWNHVVGIYNGQDLRIVLNGEAAGILEGKPDGISVSDAPLYIGTDLFARSPLFTRAALDEVRIYDRALSDEEVQALFED